MTDSPGGMEGSRHRIHKLIRTAVPSAILVGSLAVAGRGGSSGGTDTAKAPAPVKQSSSSASSGVVSAEGTLGLVGAAGRATAKKQQFEDQAENISPKANRKPGAGKKGGVGAGDACNDRDITPADGNLAQLNDAILCLVNGERTDAGLATVAANSELSQAADGMCQQMVSEHFFAHETPDGKTVVDRVQPTGYISGNDWVVGENLGWGSGALSTPQAMVNGWMNSPGHRANILAPDYKDVGLSACMGSPLTTNSGGTVYVNDFGAKSGADVNATLPSESGSSTGANADTTAAAATVAGTRARAAKSRRAKRRACVRRASKIKTHKRRVRAARRCPRHH